MTKQLKVKEDIWAVYRKEFPSQFKGQNLIPSPTKDWLNSMCELGTAWHDIEREFDNSFNVVHPSGYLIGVPKLYVDEIKEESSTIHYGAVTGRFRHDIPNISEEPRTVKN